MKNRMLNKIKIGKPCQTNWDEMTGTEKLRFCEQCQLHVHNFSAMTEVETVKLLSTPQQRICGRIEYSFWEYVRAGFNGGLFRSLRHFANGLKIGVAALIGFVGLSSSVNAQTTKTSLQNGSKASVNKPVKQRLHKRKKFVRPIQLVGILVPQAEPIPQPPLLLMQMPLPEPPARKEKEDEPPPPPRKPGENQSF